MFKFNRSITINKTVGSLLILLVFLKPVDCFSDNRQEEQEAIEAIQKATYKQLGIEEYIDSYARNLVPDKYKKYVNYVAPIAEAIKNKRLELKWEF